MTFSLAGRCERTGMVGGIVCSSSIAVPSRCLWASPHGVVLSQNVTDPRLGVLGLQLLAQGFGAQSTLRQLQDARPYAEWRQLAVLDADGSRDAATGAKGLGTIATKAGRDCIAAGNLLAHDGIPAAMAEAFEASHASSLAERLICWRLKRARRQAVRRDPCIRRVSAFTGGTSGRLRNCGWTGPMNPLPIYVRSGSATNRK